MFISWSDERVLIRFDVPCTNFPGVIERSARRFILFLFSSKISEFSASLSVMKRVYRERSDAKRTIGGIVSNSMMKMRENMALMPVLSLAPTCWYVLPRRAVGIVFILRDMYDDVVIMYGRRQIMLLKKAEGNG